MINITDLDCAGLAVQAQALLPDPALLPLHVANLQLQVDSLSNELRVIKDMLKQKGLCHD